MTVKKVLEPTFLVEFGNFSEHFLHIRLEVWGGGGGGGGIFEWQRVAVSSRDGSYTHVR